MKIGMLVLEDVTLSPAFRGKLEEALKDKLKEKVQLSPNVLRYTGKFKGIKPSLDQYDGIVLITYKSHPGSITARLVSRLERYAAKRGIKVSYAERGAAVRMPNEGKRGLFWIVDDLVRLD